VIGFDIEPRQVANVVVVQNMADAIRGRDLVFVVVPTPHRPCYGGEQPTSHLPAQDFDYDILRRVLSEAAEYLATDQALVIVSTVLPGTCRSVLAPLAPRANLIYSPSFIAMGTAEQDLEYPDLAVVGTQSGSAQGTEILLASLPSQIVHHRLHLGTWEEAEATKVFYNTFISIKIGFANMVQDVAHRLGNADSDRITQALGSASKRLISRSYLRGGMGDGGPCHPRDNIALRALAERLDLGYDLFGAVLDCREKQARNLAAFAVSFGRPVVIVGKAYKAGVPLTDGSSSLLVGHYIAELGALAGYHDEAVECEPARSGAHTYLLAHEFTSLREPRFPDESIIVDPWRTCPFIEGCVVYPYGNSRAPETRTSP
jgi:UDPglucose 6-dehydrogenase